MRLIKRILIANRGEIAVRIIKTCKIESIEVVTVHTKKEKDLPHVTNADISVCMGDGNLLDTYLNRKLLIDIAKDYNVCAIHPGYGFLSENFLFAKEVVDAGIIFIGPNYDVIKKMGDKNQARILMKELKVPMIEAIEYTDLSSALSFVEKIGYPVLVKASAGGGGKGMRIVESKDYLKMAIDSAKREALSAFADDRLLIEKYLKNSHHIEVQVFGDSFNNAIHLFERECSIQRRHQKILEESPSEFFKGEDDNIRRKLLKSAVDITKGINYIGAGTIEYLLDEEGNFYFLEMNTRLQVEHPVTEKITGLDLVKLQLDVANNKKLPSQDKITPKGHSIEVRLYAEDPDNNFLPTSGAIDYFGKIENKNLRLDSGYVDGNNIMMEFDPMLAKLIAWETSRNECIDLLVSALKKLPILGVKTNREYLIRILNHKQFLKGNTSTNFIIDNSKDLKKQLNNEKLVATIYSYFNKPSYVCQEEVEDNSPWKTLKGFRLL